jgi:hypothetical protein
MLYLLSHPMERPAARALAEALESRGASVAWEGQIKQGESWESWDAEALAESRAVVALLPAGYEARSMFAYRVEKALERAAAGGVLVAVLLGDQAPSEALESLPVVRWGEAAEVARQVLEAAPAG